MIGIYTERYQTIIVQAAIWKKKEKTQKKYKIRGVLKARS